MGKPNTFNLNVFTSNKTKLPKQDIQNLKPMFYCIKKNVYQGGSRGGGGGGGRTRRAPPLKFEKNMIFLRKIVIFHTKYPKHFRASLRSAQFFLSAPTDLKSWIHPWFICYLSIQFA